jgi:putative ABC transport system permease protein
MVEELSYTQVGFAALLICVNAAISYSLQLGMGKTLLIASARTVGQLLLIGLVLEWVFQVQRWYIVVLLMSLMTLIAGITAVQRNERRFRGIWLNTIVSIWAGSWIITAYAVLIVVNVDPWYRPQYVVPLLGMILGNSMTGTSVGLATLTDSLANQRDQVEAALTLGATRWEAAQPPVRHAIRTGMIPIINMMMIVGLVSLPGMMTGQLLSGTSPIEAVKYQIVIMFLIASATALGTVTIVLLSYLRFFNAHHQFLPQRLSLPGKRGGSPFSR